MIVQLLYKDHNFDFSQEISPHFLTLIDDLELERIFQLMADQDERILDSVKKVMSCSVTDPETILYRQEILKDCIENKEVIFQLYRLLSDALECRKKTVWWSFSSNASTRFSGAVDILQVYHRYLSELADMAYKNKSHFHSKGLSRLFEEITQELNEDFLARSESLLEDLNFKNGILIEMRLGKDNRACGYQILQRNPKKFHMRWSFAPSYTLAPQDVAGSKDLTGRTDRAFYESVDILTDAASHIEGYFEALLCETAFYIGAVKLQEEMNRRKIPYCFPECSALFHRRFEDLKDLSLALRIENCTGNDFDTENKKLYIITGANQGGKTTFLRSVGQSQLMFQSGLFIAAKQAALPLCQGIFTHFKREEDASLKSGKLDEELRRLDEQVPMFQKGSLLLFNESFSSTNEREGSEICSQITHALYDNQIEQFHVSHLYTFTHGIFDQSLSDVFFIRSDRQPDTKRTFHLHEGEPLRTAFGEDLYEKIMKE